MSVALLALPLPLEHRARWRGGAMLLLFGCFGYASMILGRTQPQKSVAATENVRAQEGQFFIARLRENPRGNGNWLGADADLLERTGDSSWLNASGKVKLMFARAALSETESSLGKGSIIVSAAALDAPDGPLNPHSFDYSKFLAQRGIYQQAWLRARDFAVVAEADPPGLLDRFRSYCAARIEAHYRSPREAGVAKALLLGDKSGVDEATRLTYTATGAVHVLAVSGLHTGVIAAVVVFVMSMLFGKRWPWLRFVLLLLALLAYALLTGMSPSVVRSSFMFALVFAGKILREDSQPLNNLGAAAVLTLLISPAALFSLGFQLSYLAVAGILLFQQPIARRLATGYRYVDYVGAAVAVGIAATLGTFPVTIFHFHQFPIYFALSTPVVFGVGLALWLLVGELALDALLQLVGLSFDYTFSISNAVVYGCNEFLLALTRLPNVLLEGLWPSAITVLLLLSATAVTAVLVNRRQRRLAFAAAALFALAGSSAAWDTYTKHTTNELIVYALRSGLVVDNFSGGQLSSLQLEGVRPADHQREVAPHRAALGHAGSATLPSGITALGDTMHAQFYSIGQWRWAAVLGREPHLLAAAPEVDWVVVSKSKYIEPAELARAFPGADYLLCDRPPLWMRSAWDSLGAQVHILPDDGAYRQLE